MRDYSSVSTTDYKGICWCEFCGLGYTASKARNDHIREKHPEVLP